MVSCKSQNNSNATLDHIPGLHLSPLFRKIKIAAEGNELVSCLRQIAVERGCRHYENTFEKPSIIPEQLKALTNEELIVSLCLAHLGRSSLNIRLAAELIAARGILAGRIAALAIQERCVEIITYIAQAGRQVEPENSFWAELIICLSSGRHDGSNSLPHWSRFVSMTGITPTGKKHVEWLRPCETTQ